MKIIAKLDERKFPPILRLVVYDAPHRRMHWRIIQEYRGFLREACMKAGIETPINYPIDLYVNFVYPTSPDYDNSLTALYRAMDGKTMKGPGIVTDDSIIDHVRMWRFFPAPKK
jgi:hypothetical protein